MKKITFLIACSFFTIISCNKKSHDNVPPVITLNGNDVVRIQIGQDYNELGATASDNLDGDISSRIQISGTVNKQLAGEYHITYKVTDASSNDASLDRTVIVFNSADSFTGIYNAYEWLQGETFSGGVYTPNGQTRNLSYTVNVVPKNDVDSVVCIYNINNLGNTYYSLIKVHANMNFDAYSYTPIQQLPNGRGLQIYGNGHLTTDSLNFTHIRYMKALFNYPTIIESGYINSKK